MNSKRNLLTTTGALLMAGLVSPSWAQSQRRATPSQTEGPFYPVAEPKDADYDLLKKRHVGLHPRPAKLGRRRGD